MSNINKSELLVENLFKLKLLQIQKEQRDRRIVDQPIGGDTLKYMGTPSGSPISVVYQNPATNDYLRGTDDVRFTFELTPVVPRILQWQVLVGIYQSETFDPYYEWPAGPIAEEVPWDHFWEVGVWWDYLQSDDETGKRVFHVDFYGNVPTEYLAQLGLLLKIYTPQVKSGINV